MQFYLIVGLAAALATASPMGGLNDFDGQPLSLGEQKSFPGKSSEVITGESASDFQTDIPEPIKIFPFIEYGNSRYDITAVKKDVKGITEGYRPYGVQRDLNAPYQKSGKTIVSWFLIHLSGEKVAIGIKKKSENVGEAKTPQAYKYLASNGVELGFTESLEPLELAKPNNKLDDFTRDGILKPLVFAKPSDILDDFTLEGYRIAPTVRTSTQTSEDVAYDLTVTDDIDKGAMIKYVIVTKAKDNKLKKSKKFKKPKMFKMERGFNIVDNEGAPGNELSTLTPGHSKLTPTETESLGMVNGDGLTSQSAFRSDGAMI